VRRSPWRTVSTGICLATGAETAGAPVASGLAALLINLLEARAANLAKNKGAVKEGRTVLWVY